MAAHSEWPTDSQIFLLPMFVLVPLAYIHKQIDKIVQQMSNVCLQNANGKKTKKKLHNRFTLVTATIVGILRCDNNDDSMKTKEQNSRMSNMYI